MTFLRNIFTLSVLSLLFSSCGDKAEDGDLAHIAYNPQPYAIVKPAYFPPVPVPADNPMTYEGVQLGRRLFYDPILSADSTMSCSSCHLPQFNFTDGKAVSTGIDGIAGKRSSMALINIAYAPALFWDGRAATLEAQALAPVEDPIELHHTWPELMEKLKLHPVYPEMFRKAFGINDRTEMTKELAAKAIAQFERIMISSGASEWDRHKNNGGTLEFEDETEIGRLMFFDEGLPVGLPDGECFHCHGTVTLNGGQYFNNGLEPFESITDIGREKVTGLESDRGKFRAPTLRNIVLTAPYMHDGRFQTLEQVVDHYFSGGHPSPNLTSDFRNLKNNSAQFNELHKQSIIAFLHTLTDTTFIHNPDLQNPF